MLPRPEPDTENPAHEEPGGLPEDPIAIGLRPAAMLASSVWCWPASDGAGRAAQHERAYKAPVRYCVASRRHPALRTLEIGLVSFAEAAHGVLSRRG
jgi:hypothetical protein